MKTKSKTNKKRSGPTTKLVPVPRAARLTAVAHSVVPAKDRRLSFGNKWDYAPAPETFDYIKIPGLQQLFINGEFVAPHSGKYFESINPATEETLTEIAVADQHD